MHSCDLEMQSLVFLPCTSSSTYIVVDGCHHPGWCVECVVYVCVFTYSSYPYRVSIKHNSALFQMQMFEVSNVTKLIFKIRSRM